MQSVGRVPGPRSTGERRAPARWRPAAPRTPGAAPAPARSGSAPSPGPGRAGRGRGGRAGCKGGCIPPVSPLCTPARTSCSWCRRRSRCPRPGPGGNPARTRGYHSSAPVHTDTQFSKVKHSATVPTFLPHGPGLAAWQGQSLVSWPPRQVTDTGVSQGGQGRATHSHSGPRASQGPAGLAPVCSFCLTRSWQGAGQEWPDSPQESGRPQVWRQVGQSPG